FITLNGCYDDDHEFGEVTAPSNLTIDFEVLNVSEEFPDGDGQGLVRFNFNADRATTYKLVFGDNSSISTSSNSVEHKYNMTGTNTYLVTVIAYGTGGASTSSTASVIVFSSFSDDHTKQLLT